jgi:hypothetical protein
MGLVQELDFQGPGAFVDVSEMTSIRRDDLQERYFLVDAGEWSSIATAAAFCWKISARLLGEENLTQDRQQRGR